MNNNSVRFSDPTGHDIDCAVGDPDRETGIHSSDDNPPTPANQSCGGSPYNFYCDPTAVENGTLYSSVTVSFPKFKSPLPSYNKDPLGNDNSIPAKGPIAVIKLFALLAGLLRPHAPPSTSTLDGMLFYSVFEDGSVSFNGVAVTNNSDKPAIIEEVSITFVGDTILTQSASSVVNTNVLPGQTETQQIASIVISTETYLGAQAQISIIIPGIGVLPLYYIEW